MRGYRTLKENALFLGNQQKGNIMAYMRNNIRTVFWPYFASIALLLFMYFVSKLQLVSVGVYTREVNATLDVNPFMGLISNLGLIMWSVTAGVCFFVSYIRKSMFLFSFGILTTFLLFDDMLMFHELVIPTYLHLLEIMVYLTYGLGVMYCFVAFSKQILSTNYFILLMALCFFGISILTDVVWAEGFRGAVLVEDGAKFLGIVSWLIYFIKVCFNEMQTKGSE